MGQSVTNFIPISDRVLLLQVQSNPINMNIIQIYALTADKSEEEKELLYQNIQEVFCRLPKNNLNIIMGDFNAKLGVGVKTAFVGPHGL